MLLNVEYLRDPADLSCQCWALLPLALDLEAATGIATAMSEGFGARLDALSRGAS